VRIYHLDLLLVEWPDPDHHVDVVPVHVRLSPHHLETPQVPFSDSDDFFISENLNLKSVGFTVWPAKILATAMCSNKKFMVFYINVSDKAEHVLLQEIGSISQIYSLDKLTVLKVSFSRKIIK
jgi:hypothetical protein